MNGSKVFDFNKKKHKLKMIKQVFFISGRPAFGAPSTQRKCCKMIHARECQSTPTWACISGRAATGTAGQDEADPTPASAMQKHGPPIPPPGHLKGTISLCFALSKQAVNAHAPTSH